MQTISVIMPCYQCEETVKRTVHSVQAQTGIDWELIAVDDGSTDHTSALLDALAHEDARIHVIHRENGGVSSARNAGMDAARGDFLTFVDADDLLLPGALAHLRDLDDGQADILCAAYIMRYEDEGRRERVFRCPHGDLQTMEESLIRSEGGLNPMYAKAYRTTWIQDNALRVSLGVRVGEDVLFNLEAFRAARAWCISDTPVYLYAFGGDSAMTRACRSVYAQSEAMLSGIDRYIERSGRQTALFRAHLDIYLRTLRADRGRFRAAFAFRRAMVSRITRGVQFAALDKKQKLYYAALRILPCLSYFLP